MKRNKLLLLLVLLAAVATGAWATDHTTLAVGDVIKVGDTFTPTADGAFYNEFGFYSGETYTLIRADVDNDYNVTEKTDGAYYVFKYESLMYPYIHFEKDFAVTAISDGLEVTKIETIKGMPFYTLVLHESAAPAPVAGYSVTMKDGTEEAENWKAKVGNGELQALPLTGLTGDGTETVTITYTGTKRVKSVKAVKVASSFTKVTTFSELQTALSAGKNVKLMNDIVCTAEIEISSDGALTIDGNGKKLSTTSAIRAFTVKSSATVAFKNLTLTGFVSGGGPAINNNGGTIVLDGCTISNCHVSNTQGGGAIENKGTGKLYAINTTFSGNHSGEIGGAINNFNGSLYMSGCTFTDNYTTSSNAYYGGAIGINFGDEVRLINCSFSGNKYGTATGTNDIGVYNKPTNYTIAGCTGATIASSVGDITTNASGTATLDYSDLSNISFTYTPVTVTWNPVNVNGSPYTKDGVTLTTTNNAAVGNIFYDRGDKTFTTTLGKFTKIEIVCNLSDDINGWTKEVVGQYEPDPVDMPGFMENIYKLTWTGNDESVTIQQGKKVYEIQSITFTIQ